MEYLLFNGNFLGRTLAESRIKRVAAAGVGAKESSQFTQNYRVKKRGYNG
jgi:hypothetical protein